MVVFASCLCCKLFIMCFLRSALIAFQRKKFEKYFFDWALRRPAKKYLLFVSLRGHFAVCEACVLFGNKSASFNSQFEQQHLV